MNRNAQIKQPMYSNNPNDLNFPLLYFDADKQFAWTLEDAVRGCQVFGGIGSGKTSGSGKNIAKSFISNGYGGLVCCAKKDERAAWVDYAKQCGRLDDLIIFSEKNPFRFNFLDYELNRKSRGGGETLGVVKLYNTIHEMSRRNSGSGQGSEDRFWESALNRLLTRLVELIKLSGEVLSVENMYQILVSSPKSTDAFEDEKWVNSSYCVKCLEKAAVDHEDSYEFKLVDSYFASEFATLDEKTRSIVSESAMALFELFMTPGILRDLFTNETNVTPDVTFTSNKIIILDIPVQTHGEVGIIAQSLFKYMWQQCAERRDLKENPTPAFLWVDEAQFFLNKQDALFQTTCRSSKICTVFLSQNISNYYSVMSGGARYKETTDSFLALMATKIFHAQNDFVTNRWASDTIAEDFRLVSNFNSRMGKEGGSSGASEQMMHQVRPVEFSLLFNGGIMNNYKVEAFITIAGRPLSNGKNYMKVTFDQRG